MMTIIMKTTFSLWRICLLATFTLKWPEWAINFSKEQLSILPFSISWVHLTIWNTSEIYLYLHFYYFSCPVFLLLLKIGPLLRSILHNRHIVSGILRCSCVWRYRWQRFCQTTDMTWICSSASRTIALNITTTRRATVAWLSLRVAVLWTTQRLTIPPTSPAAACCGTELQNRGRLFTVLFCHLVFFHCMFVRDWSALLLVAVSRYYYYYIENDKKINNLQKFKFLNFFKFSKSKNCKLIIKMSSVSRTRVLNAREMLKLNAVEPSTQTCSS